MTVNKILIIDDDPRNIFALNAILKSHGYQTVTANQALAGIDLMKTEENISVILLDMMMPGMDGYEALPAIRQQSGTRHIPVIAVTAQAMKGDREKCLAAGADEYIAKPIDVDILMNKLAELITS